MSNMRHDFNTRSAPMLYARDRRTGSIIALPGDRIGADWYDDKTHKGHLTCLDCNTPVHFNKGAEITDGSRKGLENQLSRRAHFKTNPGTAHDMGCQLAQDAISGEALTTGFRLNFNTSTADYYDNDHESILPEHLQGISLKGTEDLVNFMRLNDIERIKKSYAVHREFESTWENFMLSDSDPHCRQHLIDTVSMMRRSQQRFNLSALELHVDKNKIGHTVKNWDKIYVRGKSVKVIDEDRHGIAHIILPRYTFQKSDEWEAGELSDLFERKSDTFIAQGLGEVSVQCLGSAKFYYYEMKVITPAQVVRDNLANLLKQNRLHHLKKEELALQRA